MFTYERQAEKKGCRRIAGVDEAGRGPLAGPVVAAACILPLKNLGIRGINDSKLLTPQVREKLFLRITDDPRISFGIGIVQPSIIDQINIYQATIQAMLQAIAQLQPDPDMLLVDGLKLPHAYIECEKIIQGDSKSMSIAAASILAKVTRDRIMCEYHEKFPEYGFHQHKGYGTERHMEALLKHGPCEIHRFSFEPVRLRRG